MATYLVPQENSVPIMTQAALSEAPSISHAVLFISPTPMLNVKSICAVLRDHMQIVSSKSLVNGDVVIFELPLTTSDHAIWTGLSLYKTAIQNKIGGDAKVHVVPMSCLPWS